MSAPDPPHRTLNSCFVAFRTVLLLHGSRCKTRRTGGINVQVHTVKSFVTFSQRTHPMHHIGDIRHGLGRFAPFHYCMKVGAKLAELVQLMHKVVQRGRIGSFHNEYTLMRTR
jgi:hypothetical protein